MEVADPDFVHRQAGHHFCYLPDIERHLRVASVHEHLVAYVCGSLLFRSVKSSLNYPKSISLN